VAASSDFAGADADGKTAFEGMLLFADNPPLVKNSLLISGSNEPEQMRRIVQTMVADAKDERARLCNSTRDARELLFDSAVLTEMRKWNKKLLEQTRMWCGVS